MLLQHCLQAWGNDTMQCKIHMHLRVLSPTGWCQVHVQLIALLNQMARCSCRVVQSSVAWNMSMEFMPQDNVQSSSSSISPAFYQGCSWRGMCHEFA